MTAPYCAAAGLALALCLLCPAPAGAAKDLATAADAMARAAAEEQAAQAGLDAWAEKRPSILEAIRADRERLRWLERAVARREAYLAKQRQALEQLRQAAASDHGQELEPLLDHLLERLQAFIARDLGFLPQERAARLETLKADLADYSLAMGEKLRRFLEALQVEAAYGARAEAEDAAIDLEGAAVGGRVLRLGRAAAFFLSRDNRLAARLLPGDAAWRPLPPSQAEDIQRAMDMVAHRRAFELVRLPMGGVLPLEVRP